MTDSASALEKIAPEYRRLLDLPIFVALGTVRPDGAPQVNPMWFEFDGTNIRFTHTTKRAKYRNLQSNPAMSVAFVDPENGYSYLEVRGSLVEVIPDPEGDFYSHLSERYGNGPHVPPDKADRVILVMSIEHTTSQ